MSEAFDRGRAFENKVRKIMSSKLKQFDIRRDKQSGAGIHKQDIRDRFNELPLFIECKDHKTTKLKEWWREADAKSNFGQHATVVFPDNEEVLAVMRFSDLLDIVGEMLDWKNTTEFLRQPEPPETIKVKPAKKPSARPADPDFMPEVGMDITPAVDRRINHGAQTCRNGHIADTYGYCMQKDCKYSRGYRPPKKPKK